MILVYIASIMINETTDCGNTVRFKFVNVDFKIALCYNKIG